MNPIESLRKSYHQINCQFNMYIHDNHHHHYYNTYLVSQLPSFFRVTKKQRCFIIITRFLLYTMEWSGLCIYLRFYWHPFPPDTPTFFSHFPTHTSDQSGRFPCCVTSNKISTHGSFHNHSNWYSPWNPRYSPNDVLVHLATRCHSILWKPKFIPVLTYPQDHVVH